MFRCPRLRLCTVGNPLTSSTGRSQSRAIGEVVAPVALLFGIALSPKSPVRYGRHRRKVVISLRSPSLVLLGLGLPLLSPLLRFCRLALYCLLSLAGTLLPSPPGHFSLMMVLSWDLALLRACSFEILLFLGVSCCRLCLSRDMHLPRSGFRWAYGLYSVLPHTSYVLVWIRISLWGSLAPSAGLHAPGTSTPLCVLLRPWLCPAGSLIPSLICQNGVYGWAKGGLPMVLGFWCSFLDGLEVSLLFLGCSLSGWGFFL